MKCYKNILCSLCFALLISLGVSFDAQARSVNISGADGSLSLHKKMAKFPGVPVMTTIKIQHGYMPGVPAPVTVSYKYWNARVKVSGLGRVPAYKYFRYVTIVPTALFQAKSCRPTLEESCNFDPTLTQGQPGESVVFDAASSSPPQDWSFASFFRPKAKIYRGKTKSYRMWVTFPRCLQLDQSRPSSPPPSGWPCQPGEMEVRAEFYLRGKGLRGHGYVGFTSNNLFVHPPAQ